MFRLSVYVCCHPVIVSYPHLPLPIEAIKGIDPSFRVLFYKQFSGCLLWTPEVSIPATKTCEMAVTVCGFK